MDFDNALVETFAKQHGTGNNPQEIAVSLYYAVRDGFKYNPFIIDLSHNGLKASTTITRGEGYCGEKANLLAAVARYCGIPARLGFAIVRNHIGTDRLEQLLQTDRLVFHGYTELFINEKWVKATPAFNKALCDKLGVEPLEFDGETDSIFQEFDHDGGRYMEYLHYYGEFAEVPRDYMIAELKANYPHLFQPNLPKIEGMLFTTGD